LDHTTHREQTVINKRTCILLATLALLACGYALRGTTQTMPLRSPEEAAILKEEILALGFQPIGHADGLLKEGKVSYSISGYAFAGRYDNLRTEITIRIYTPPKESQLPLSRNAVIRCWARGSAEATSLKLLNELTRRTRERTALATPPPATTNTAPAP
jgi:hypothetical protein